MSKIRERLLYELQREPKERKISFQNFVGRLILGFLVMMLFLTIVSRAADSVTVAKVDVSSVKRANLNFTVSGVGTLGAKAEKYLNLYEGVRIENIYVKAGQNVEKGSLLFQYDIIDLKDRLEGLKDELVKAELNLEKEKLSYRAGKAGTAKEAAQLTLERARIDLKTAKEDLKTAKKTIDKEKKKEYEEAKKAYGEALESYKKQEDKQEKAISQANKKVLEAIEALEEVYEKKSKTEMSLLNYKAALEGNKIDEINTVEINIFKVFYGDTEYVNHQKSVEKAKKTVTRAYEDYRNSKEALKEGEELSSSEHARYKRAIEDTEEALAELTKKDNELSTAIWAYRNAIQYNNMETGKTYSILFSMLYTEDNETRKLIDSANKTITMSQEALTETTEEWKNTLRKEAEVVFQAEAAQNAAKAIHDKIIMKTYDYSQDVKTEEKLLMGASRAVEDAKIGLEDAEKSDKEIAVNNNANGQIQSLNLELSEMDIQNKKDAVTEIEHIIENKGKVNSPVTGVLVELGIEVGNSVTGAEKVCFSLSNYGFEAKVSKEEAKYLAVGDEMSIKVGESKEELSVLIEYISLEDAQGKITITGIMPKGNYTVGTPSTFKVSEQSKEYRQTIPIQALRMDGYNKTFVLVTKETNTILGSELTALRMDITVLEKDYTTAAIEGGLNPEDKIIVSSNKNIEEGDRVRLNDSSNQIN